MTAQVQPRSKSVQQRELEEVERRREEVRCLRAQLRDAEAAVAQRERDLIERLKAGAAVRGRLAAVVSTVAGPSCPSYQEELLAHFEQSHGVARELVLAEVRKRWPGKVSEKLVIAEKGGPKKVD